MTLNVDVPFEIELGDFTLSASLTGQIVAYTPTPEPSSIVIAGLGALGLCVIGRRRLGRSA